MHVHTQRQIETNKCVPSEEWQKQEGSDEETSHRCLSRHFICFTFPKIGRQKSQWANGPFLCLRRQPHGLEVAVYLGCQTAFWLSLMSGFSFAACVRLYFVTPPTRGLHFELRWTLLKGQWMLCRWEIHTQTCSNTTSSLLSYYICQNIYS